MTTKGCRARLERLVGISTASGSSAARGLRGAMCLAFFGLATSAPLPLPGRSKSGGWGSPETDTALPGFCGADPRAGGRSAAAARTAAGAARVAAPAVGAAGAARTVEAVRGGPPLPLAGRGAIGLAALSAPVAAGRGFCAMEAADAGLVAIGTTGGRGSCRATGFAAAGDWILADCPAAGAVGAGFSAPRAGATPRRRRRRTVALFRRLVGAAHRLVSTFLPGMNQQGE